MRQNLAWAVGYNAVAIPVAAGLFQPLLGVTLRPEIAAIAMSGSTLIVTVNALMLKRVSVPRLQAAASPDAVLVGHESRA